MKLKTWIRRFAFLLVGLGLLAIVLYFAAQKYAKNKVIAVIQEIVDGPVEVDDVRLGRDQIEVRGIRVYESESDKTAWLTIDKAVLGLTLSDAIRGETIPEFARIHGANIVLEYDENRKLLTDFSLWKDGVEMRLKELDIEDANVEIRQQGRTPLIAKHINAKLSGNTKDIQVQATVGDALNAEWEFSAHIEGDTFATKCELSTNELRFSTDELVKLPFIPEGLGQEIRASGVSPIRLTLQINEGDPKYRVALSPRSLSVDVLRAGLSITSAEGNIALQNDLVSFTELRGDIAGGQFSGDGSLRAKGETWSGQVQGKLSDIALAGLPKQWQLPEEVRGSASGHGTLNFELADSHIELRGTANATIEQAQLAGISARPIKIGVQLEKLRKPTDASEVTLVGNATVDVNIPDVELIELMKAAEIDSTELKDLTGRVGFQAALSIPLATVTDPKTFHAKGELASSGMQFRDIPFSDVQGSFEFENGIASVRNLNTKIAETGQLRGSVTVEVQPQGNIATAIDFEKLPVSLFEKIVDQPKVRAGGFISGDVRANVPIDDWKNPDMWQGSGRMQSDELSLEKHSLTSIDATFDVQQGRLAVMNGSAIWQGTKFETTGNVRLKSPYAYSVIAAVRNVDIETAAEIAKFDLPIEVAGQGTVNATVTGELEPLSWTATGDVALGDLTVEKLKIESPSFQWKADAERLQVTSAEAKVFGGSVKLTAEIPFNAEVASKVTGTFSALDSQILKQHLPDMPVVVTGIASGEFSLTGIEKLESATGMLKVRDLAADVYGVRVEDVVVDVSLLRQQVNLELQAKALGGTITLTSKALLDELKRESLALSARVSAVGVPLSNIWHLVGQQMRVVPPEGVVAVQLDLDLSGPSWKPKGVGRLEIHDARWNGRQLTSHLTTSISILSDSVVLRDLTFDYGKGRIAGTVMFRLDELGSGSYFVVAENIAIRKLLLSAFPKLARDANGTVDAGFRGRFAHLKFDGSGKMQVSSGRIGAIPVRSLETDIDWAFDLPSKRGKAKIRLTRAEISGGRATGEVAVQWGRQLTLKANTTFTNLDLRPLGRATSEVSDQLTGRVSGDINVQGRNVRSLDDISGTYDLKLSNSQLLRLPVLDDLTYATGIGSNSKSFTDTELKGRMNRGVIQVDRMTMVAAGVQMFIQGQLTTRGQLDLEVTADTGQLLAVGVVTGLIRPWEWLRRRLIFLHVGGTIRSPVVLPQTEKFIQQEVMLFFLPFVAW